MFKFVSPLLLAALFCLSACDSTPHGDPARGQTLYEVCKGCHELRTHKDGPAHCGLVGRSAGKMPGFVYSDAVKDSGLIWDEKTLDQFLKSPLSFLPGTRMGFAGYHDPQERADLIAYLKQTTLDPQACAGVEKPQ
jgi:cytochrome c